MSELLYFTALGVTAVIALVSNLGRFRKRRTLALQAGSAHDVLVSWAESTDWKIGDGSEVSWVERADHITDLAGFPKDWDIKSGADKRDANKYAPIRKWVYGTILSRETALGQVTIIGCWREESTAYNVFACLSGAPHVSPFTLDLLPVDHGTTTRAVADGSPPAGCTEAHLHKTLDGLPAPARLRLLGGLIVLHTVGWLSPEIAEDRCHRLLELCKVMPTGPALGPER